MTSVCWMAKGGGDKVEGSGHLCVNEQKDGSCNGCDAARAI